jgi:serine/threonine protein kinase/formylglycine-generating enzyme required for sulfatase activity
MRECPACKLCFPDEIANCPIDGDATIFSIAGEPTLEGKYHLERRLGQGGMGVVFKARHNFLKTQHAVKVILPDLVGNDPNLITRFRQEAIASAAVKHHNIVSVTDFGVVNGKMPFIVMEFVKGESLHDLLVREKRLTPEKSLQILTGICAGVAAAHRQNIVHRDLKPLNVMICDDREPPEAVKILDFGLAKIKSGELLGSFIAAQTTGLMGSPYYMAPEQWSDEEPDARADVYSLGVILFQMLAGEVPFKGSSIPAIMKKHLSDAPPHFSTYGLQLSPAVEAVVLHALEKDLTKRTQSVEQLVAEMREAVGYNTEIHRTNSDLILETLGGKSKKTLNLRVSQTPAAISAPFTTLRILTEPPEAAVFLDGELVNAQKINGWLILDKVPRGKHRLRVTSEGFFDSETEIVCDSEVCQTVVELRNALATNIAPQQNFDTEERQTDIALKPVSQKNAPNNVGIRSYPEPKFEKTNIGGRQTLRGENLTQIETPLELPRKSNYLFPLLVGVGALVLIAFVVVAFVAVKYIPDKKPEGDNSIPTPSIQPSASPFGSAPTAPTTNMALIEGGNFMMGRKDGPPDATPAHLVSVKSFMMDKTEVTNAEYADFVAETGHRAPEEWVNNRPLKEREMLPVTQVTLDDAKEFAKWRSKRDGAVYRLPTEMEWEYAARNGASASLYPWGNKWEDHRAAINESTLRPVGSLPEGANKWGVMDLIGNVWEWTDTPAFSYPGNPREVDKTQSIKYVVRGGSVQQKKEEITAAFRGFFDPTKSNRLLGFRLVKDAQ